MVNLDKNEDIVFEARRHWFVMFPAALSFVVLAFILPIIYLVLGYMGVSVDVGGQGFFLALFLYTILLLAMWLFFFVSWTSYYLDVWYITNKRIIDVEQKTIFHRETISLRYEQIQDVTAETRGLIPTLLGFGDLHVQTAAGSQKRKIILRSAVDPSKVKKIILARQGEVTERVKTVRFESGDLPPNIADKISN